MTVTEKFKQDSARAAIKALRGLEQTAIMLEERAEKDFPEINELGQKHFHRVVMESAATKIRNALAQAIADAENSNLADHVKETELLKRRVAILMGMLVPLAAITGGLLERIGLEDTPSVARARAIIDNIRKHFPSPDAPKIAALEAPGAAEPVPSDDHGGTGEGWRFDLDAMPAEGEFEALQRIQAVVRYEEVEHYVILPGGGGFFLPVAWRPKDGAA